MTMNCGHVTDTKKTDWEIVSCQMCFQWMYVLNAYMAFSEMDTLIPLVIVAGNLICMCV